MKYCTQCGTPHDDKAIFCTNCGHKFTAESTKPKEKKVDDSVVETIYDYLGSEKAKGISWRILFTDVLKEHNADEAEEIFVCGTPRTTPDPSTVSDEFPKPWLYTRVFLMLFFTFILLWICCAAFNNSNALPGTMVIGSFVVPISTLILFFELNVWRNISFFKVLKVFMLGGGASLVFTLILFSLVPVGKLDYVGAFLTGCIEEVGKAIIVYYFLKQIKTPTILNGLLLGACVGAGFAAFESAGYAFRVFSMGGFDTMLQVIFLRGFLAPGGHVAWAAISGAAIVMAFQNEEKRTLSSVINNAKFIRLFIIPVAMHFLWDSPLASTILPNIFGFHIGLIIAVWIVLLVLVDMGLSEVSKYKNKTSDEVSEV